MSKLQRYKQTWDSTTTLIPRDDGDYYKVIDVEKLPVLQPNQIEELRQIADEWMTPSGRDAIENWLAKLYFNQ